MGNADDGDIIEEEPDDKITPPAGVTSGVSFTRR